MNKVYIVDLTEAERMELKALIAGGEPGARRVRRAHTLLMADDNAHTDKQIAAALSCGTATVYRVRQRFVEEGLQQALSEKPRPGGSRLLNAQQEAKLVALACMKAPKGRSRWTLRLLADRFVLLCDDLDGISKDTVRRRLKENKLKPWLRKMWCLRTIDAEFIAKMEDVLDLYTEAPDPRFPVICFDESLKQLVGEVTAPRLPLPGHPAQQDYHYTRGGTAKLLVFYDVHGAKREVIVSERRRHQEYALAMRKLVDEMYPEAEKIRVVQDNLNIHRPASLYAAFPAEEARRILRKLEFHYTPKHASWLNMVEIEIGALSTQCLDRRIGDIETLREEVAACVAARNEEGVAIEWMFDVGTARTKMARHYPTPSLS